MRKFTGQNLGQFISNLGVIFWDINFTNLVVYLIKQTGCTVCYQFREWHEYGQGLDADLKIMDTFNQFRCISPIRTGNGN